MTGTLKMSAFYFMSRKLKILPLSLFVGVRYSKYSGTEEYRWTDLHSCTVQTGASLKWFSTCVGTEFGAAAIYTGGFQNQ